MTHSRGALLFVLALVACRDVTTSTQPPQLLHLTISTLSKVALPANASIPVFAWAEYAPGSPNSRWCPTWASSDSTVASLTGYLGGSVCDLSVELHTRQPGSAMLTVSFGDKADTASVTVLPALQVASIVAGVFVWGITHACALTPAGDAYCWGPSPDGASGLDTTRDDCGDGCNLIPRPVADGLTWGTLATSYSTTCATTLGGDLYCWGKGYAPIPTRVAASVTFTSLSAGRSHVCGLTADGSAYCWGNNDYGQLGNGTQESSTTPVHVAGGLHFSTISAGTSHSCALASDAVAYCWGLNSSGVLGTGDTMSSLVPARVSGNLALVALSAGGGHTCALASDGAAYCWGRNYAGQLGLGFVGPYDTTCGSPPWCSKVPVRVPGGQSFGSIDATGDRTCGITNSGAAYCWGAMSAPGQCGGGDLPGWCPPGTEAIVTPETLAGAPLFESHGGQGGCWIGVDRAAYCWDGWRGHPPVRVAGQRP